MGLSLSLSASVNVTHVVLVVSLHRLGRSSLCLFPGGFFFTFLRTFFFYLLLLFFSFSHSLSLLVMRTPGVFDQTDCRCKLRRFLSFFLSLFLFSLFSHLSQYHSVSLSLSVCLSVCPSV